MNELITSHRVGSHHRLTVTLKTSKALHQPTARSAKTHIDQ